LYSIDPQPQQIAAAEPAKSVMDKKTKKRVDVIRAKLQQLRRVLSDAKKQHDEPDEIVNLERDIQKLEKELAELTAD
jgi:septal ring factor EnvC (AmiA/AmiB activator)